MTATEKHKLSELTDLFTVNASLFLRVSREKNEEQREAHWQVFTEHYTKLAKQMLELNELI